MKADDDLVSYIRQLELPLGEALVAVEAGGSISTEHLVLVRSVFREIKKREATLATHKKCSFVVELLLKTATVQQLVSFFAAIAFYMDFMCTNRYASHVLETLLSLAHALLSGERAFAVDADGDDADGDDSALPTTTPESLRSQLVTSIVAMATALQVRTQSVYGI